MKPHLFLVAIAAYILQLTLIPVVEAATISGGSLTLNIDRDKLIAGVTLDFTPAPSIYVEEFFNANAASRSFDQILEDHTPSDVFDYAANEISAVGLQYAVNGPSIPLNPDRRQNKPTTFNFDPGNILGSATGAIGLGGVIRFRVDVPTARNRVLLGDMTLEYAPALEGFTPGRSGWVLLNHIGFDAGAFNLFDVSTRLNGNTLTLSGELGLGDGFDHLSGQRDTRVGTFTFETTVVPLPATIWLFVSALTGLSLKSRLSRLNIS